MAIINRLETVVVNNLRSRQAESHSEKLGDAHSSASDSEPLTESKLEENDGTASSEIVFPLPGRSKWGYGWIILLVLIGAGNTKSFYNYDEPQLSGIVSIIPVVN